MIEKIGHIKNPLTVIAIFAGIAEISGTAILPFIEKGNQSLYIWFLIFFPTFLVTIFFLTLNFNHKKLYSPSDYKDENNFISSISKVTPEERENKLQKEVKEVEEDLKKQDKPAEPEKPNKTIEKEQVNNQKKAESSSVPIGINVTEVRQKLSNDLELAEKLAVRKLSKTTGLNFSRDRRLNIPHMSSQLFDAVALEGKTLHVAEVKVFSTKQIDISRISDAMFNASRASDFMKEKHGWQDFILHLFLVTDITGDRWEKLTRDIFDMALKLGVTYKLQIDSLESLKNEYEYG